MQYPFRVTIATKKDLFSYRVKANDVHQARRRALRQFEQDQGPEAVGEVIRTVNLTPKQLDGEFLPSVERAVVGAPCATAAQAVDAAVAFLDNRAAR